MPTADWRTIVSKETQSKVLAVEELCAKVQRKAQDFPSGAEYQVGDSPPCISICTSGLAAF